MRSRVQLGRRGRPRRWPRPSTIVVLLALWGVVAVGATAAGATDIGATDTASPTVELEPGHDGVELRNWFFAIAAVRGDRERHDVFVDPGAQTSAPTGDADGIGLAFGRRFGDRFVLGLRIYALRQGTAVADHEYADFEALVSGTVFFRPRSTLQPFLRGGVGIAGLLLDQPPDLYTVYGTAAIAGGGLQIRCSAGFSLEFEAAGTFVNYFQGGVNLGDDDERTWDLREPNAGWRIGAGAVVWF